MGNCPICAEVSTHIYVVAALILFLGVAAIRSMPTDIFPEIRIPVVTVIWS
jgi:multidrug efflux pump subunit AcrB